MWQDGATRFCGCKGKHFPASGKIFTAFFVKTPVRLGFLRIKKYLCISFAKARDPSPIIGHENKFILPHIFFFRNNNKDMVELFSGALDNINYWWIIALMAIESSFIPFPSEVVMIPAAYMAAEKGEMSFPLILLCGTFGALIGALVNYALAYYLGRPIVYRFANSRFGHLCLIDQEKVEKAERYFDKHGAVSTLVGRMIPAIRQLISIPAGLARMNMGSFIFFTCMGAALWNSVLLSLGYFFHSQVDKDTLIGTIADYSHIIGIAAIVMVVAGITFLIYKGRKKARENAANQNE